MSGGLGRADGVVLRDGHLGYVGTCLCEDVDRRHHQVTHIGLGIVEALLEHPDAQPGHTVGQPAEQVNAGGDVSCLAGIVRVVTRRGLEGSRRILHGTGSTDPCSRCSGPSRS